MAVRLVLVGAWLLLAGCWPTAPDVDGDGYNVDEDCDDSDPAVHPGAAELPTDGLDNDCDLLVDCVDPDLDGTWVGNATADDVPDLCDGLCTLTIAGDLTLEASALTDLDPLACLVAVEGDLAVGGCGAIDAGPLQNPLGNPSLTSIAGLSNLRSLGGDLTVSDNDLLPSLVGLEGLESLAGDLSVGCNGGPLSLVGLDHVASVAGDVRIYQNAALGSLTGLDAVTSVGGDLIVYVHPGLTSLAGLEALGDIGGDLYVFRAPRLTSLGALDGLGSIGGGLRLTDVGLTSVAALANLTSLTHLVIAAHDLTDLDGLDQVVGPLDGDLFVSGRSLASISALRNVTSVGGMLGIQTTALPSLDGLARLTGVGTAPGEFELRILDNPELRSIGDLRNVTSFDGHIRVESNPRLASLEGIAGFRDAHGLIIARNDALTSLTGLDAYTRAAQVAVTFNPSLLSLEGLGGMTDIAGLTITSNERLATLAGLGPVTTVSTFLILHANPSLTSLVGLDHLDTAGQVIIGANDALPTLDGLDALTTISDLSIAANAALRDVTALYGVVRVDVNVEIVDNPVLGDATAQALVDEIDSIGGSVSIGGNGP